MDNYNNKLNIRNELKYIISTRYSYDLYYHLRSICSIDKNVVNGQSYCVRSLYFDDAENSFLYDKINGIKDRIKIRIRTYLPKSVLFKIEIKSKFNNYVKKEAVIISDELVHKLIGGEFHLENDNSVINQIFMLNSVNKLSPVVLIDYWRKPLIYHQGNDPVRITIDSQIRSSVGHFDIFDTKPCMHPVLRPEMAVLEVKYRSEIPTPITRALESIPVMRSSFSKYALARRPSLTQAFDM